MRGKRTKDKIISLSVFCFSLILFVFVCSVSSAESSKKGIPSVIKDIWDPAKYISVDEVKPGMEAYCLTIYEGTEIERFELDVISVVRDISPGKNAILVQGTDERFIHTGPVGGCSGSPVYIEGRLAGALAFGWTFSKDPLYGVTPIEEMLSVGIAQGKGRKRERMFDFSGPIDFAEFYKQLTEPRSSNFDAVSVSRYGASGMERLPCPLVTSGLPGGVCEQLKSFVEPLGFMTVAGVGGGEAIEGVKAELVPGACLAIPFVSGDIKMTAMGTVTEVVGDKVYGFGHSLLGYGEVDLPIATGQVHTVVSSVIRSFKYASALETVGALRIDESSAIFGQIGAKAKTIPLTIKVDRYNDVEKRVYNCEVINNRLMSARMLGTAVSGAVFTGGEFPPDHMVEYKVNINIEGAEPVTFENVSTGMYADEMLTEAIVSISLIMHNPYKEVDIESVDFDIRITDKDISSRIWSVDLSDSKVKAGERVDIEVIIESVLAGKKKYRQSLKVPDDLVPGRYDLIVSGSSGYQRFLRKAAVYRFVHQNFVTLIEAMNNALAVKRDRLYFVLVLPSGGITLEKAELPDLPATRALAG